jgi:hypothetical protein
MATDRERRNINLDYGVFVNFNKFGKAIRVAKGLNDKVTKKKVSGFDWIDNKDKIKQYQIKWKKNSQ